MVYTNSMYSLGDSLHVVKGIGPQSAAQFAKKNLSTVKDLLVWVPLRYEDRSVRSTIAEAPQQQIITISAFVVRANNYYKGRRSIQSALIADQTGKLKVMWFNNHFIIDKLKIGQEFLFAGEINDRGVMLQPTVEAVGGENIHTDRLVPIYSQLPGLKGGTVRRLFKQVLDSLEKSADPLALDSDIMERTLALNQLHFPDDEEKIIQARERLALEELLALMHHSRQLKAQWQARYHSLALELPTQLVPESVPFTLTGSQQRSLNEIMTDLSRTTTMNRLLIGDVGSGKTVVAGSASWWMTQAGHHVALVAPTRILAEQHLITLQKLFPAMPVELITSASKKMPAASQATCYVGTHAVINRLDSLQPALIIYDEQHRFGVTQRSGEVTSAVQPHILTMTATPIPRTLMLTIFSHLSLSTIDELPAGRIPTKTWLVPESKRNSSYAWIAEQIQEARQAGKVCQVLVICPFIDPSQAEALSNVAAVNDTLTKVQAVLGGVGRIGSLHGRMSKKDQQQVVQSMFNQELDVLVTTPIVEVGVDLPAASIMVIEGAERFGLASLHQLRGRVGRAGQQGYCLLFTTHAGSADTRERLKKFSESTNGQELAELDLEHRGAGDLFGTQQSGFGDLKFANWTDHHLIHRAQEVYAKLNDSVFEKLLFQKEVTKAVAAN